MDLLPGYDTWKTTHPDALLGDEQTEPCSCCVNGYPRVFGPVPRDAVGYEEDWYEEQETRLVEAGEQCVVCDGTGRVCATCGESRCRHLIPDEPDEPYEREDW